MVEGESSHLSSRNLEIEPVPEHEPSRAVIVSVDSPSTAKRMATVLHNGEKLKFEEYRGKRPFAGREGVKLANGKMAGRFVEPVQFPARGSEVVYWLDPSDTCVTRWCDAEKWDQAQQEWNAREQAATGN